VDAVLTARPRRVVVGMRDPDPRTAGRGIRRLRRAGIEVEVGVEEQACRALNRGFISRVERGRPFSVLKLAASLDGRIATRTAASRWITGPAARVEVHRLRARADAVVVGSRTVLADDPRLTARRGERTLRAPLRVVVDSRLRTPPTAALVEPGLSCILTTRAAAARRRAALERAGAQVVDVRQRRGRVDLRAAWRVLALRGVNDLLVEGGGGLAAALLREGLIDRIHLYVAPLLIGADGHAVLESLDVDVLSDAPRARNARVRRVGADWCFTWDPEND
jgi:diaminohydroxyphosphoribosylaminopyrimidine deaminase/5-amino-6-(5-phosphoribosylamino)uracil reductase